MTAGPTPAPFAPAPRAAVIGAGPAGLMAAETLASQGAQVDVFDAMPSVGRKLLLAGKGGLNLTHGEALDAFLSRYEGGARDVIVDAVRAFDPDALRAWAGDLGIETFVGTSGRVFPSDLKAAPLLRAWLAALRARGVRLHARHRWTGWEDGGDAVFGVSRTLRFEAPGREGHDAIERFEADLTVLALGGASWPQLGSDGRWAPLLASRGVGIAPLRAANCGFDVAPTAPGRNHWSDLLREAHAGQPVKPVAAWAGREEDGPRARRQGEFVLTATGVEGSLIYALAAPLRDAIERDGAATLWLDLLPQHEPARVLAELSVARGRRSLGSHLQGRLGLSALKRALLHEVLPKETMSSPPALARALKALPIRLQAPRPVAEAISTAGGVARESIEGAGMLRALPGVFVAGEMLDWEAPTGGYLLTACMASGRASAEQAITWWRARTGQTCVEHLAARR